MVVVSTCVSSIYTFRTLAKCYLRGQPSKEREGEQAHPLRSDGSGRDLTCGHGRKPSKNPANNDQESPSDTPKMKVEWGHYRNKVIMATHVLSRSWRDSRLKNPVGRCAQKYFGPLFWLGERVTGAFPENPSGSFQFSSDRKLHVQLAILVRTCLGFLPSPNCKLRMGELVTINPLPFFQLDSGFPSPPLPVLIPYPTGKIQLPTPQHPKSEVRISARARWKASQESISPRKPERSGSWFGSFFDVGSAHLLRLFFFFCGLVWFLVVGFLS